MVYEGRVFASTRNAGERRAIASIEVGTYASELIVSGFWGAAGLDRAIPYYHYWNTRD